MAKSDPARETALLTPDAVSGAIGLGGGEDEGRQRAIARLMPSDSNRTGGKMSAQ